jgi:cytochrome P450
MHHCLGAPLARLEATTALTALYARYPELTVAMPEDEIVWPDGFFLRGPVELLVEG